MFCVSCRIWPRLITKIAQMSPCEDTVQMSCLGDLTATQQPWSTGGSAGIHLHPGQMSTLMRAGHVKVLVKHIRR